MKDFVERDLLNILLNNIISNAIKYSYEKDSITIKVYKKSSCLNIEVIDHGIGISKGEINKIFEEFYRTRRGREVEKDGTGLGLSIVNNIVNVLGGTIKIHSRINKGSSFHITWPIET